MLERLKALVASSKPNEAVILPAALGTEVDELVAGGDRTKAIRLVRQRTGLGLVEATNAVKARQRS